MPATRFFLLGYGIGAVAGIWAGLHHGQLAGWLTAWLGGGMISLLIAWVWHCGLRIGGPEAMQPAGAVRHGAALAVSSQNSYRNRDLQEIAANR